MNPESILRIPSRVQNSTVAHLRECGSSFDEGFVVWSGLRDGNTVTVRTAIIPKIGIRRGYARVSFNDEVIDEISKVITTRKEVLIAQVHSHPEEAFHSAVDDAYPLVHRTGFISIVLSEFGRYGFQREGSFRVYEYINNGLWSELDEPTITKRLIFER